MKKVFSLIFTIVIAGSFAMNANAQMMGGLSNSSADWDAVVEHTIREEEEGKELWEKFSAKGGSSSGGQAKEIACADLDDEQFGVLGEYFMGQMMGDSHAAMNAMMMRMHGEEGEEQIHIVVGKRLSGCNTSAVTPGLSGGWMSMMNMMTGGWSSPFSNNSTNNMMNFGFLGWFGWIFMILWWVLIIAGIVALVRWIAGQSRSDVSEKSALDILKERYAKGEIDKKEFENKKKDL